MPIQGGYARFVGLAKIAWAVKDVCTPCARRLAGDCEPYLTGKSSGQFVYFPKNLLTFTSQGTRPVWSKCMRTRRIFSSITLSV
jgi:hypothetical protein